MHARKRERERERKRQRENERERDLTGRSVGHWVRHGIFERYGVATVSRIN